MFVTNSRKKVFTYAVVRFDVDGMIATVKTTTIYEEDYQITERSPGREKNTENKI